MSKIGKRPIKVPENVEVEIQEDKLRVKGPKGELYLKLHPQIKVEKREDHLLIKRGTESKQAKSLHGLFRNLINNLIIGVTEGYKKQLELIGLGFRASLAEEGGKQKLVLSLGFSHPLEVSTPEGIFFSITKNIITIEGIDKQLVGETAAKIRALKPPEPYKGKGIRYVGEVVRRKPGKAVVKMPGATQ